MVNWYSPVPQPPSWLGSVGLDCGCHGVVPFASLCFPQMWCFVSLSLLVIKLCPLSFCHTCIGAYDFLESSSLLYLLALSP